MVVHGIPGAYRVAEGDLITIDVGVTLDGSIADSALHVRRRRDRRATASGCSTSARTRSRPGSRRRGPATAIGDISHAVQHGRRGARASRSSAASSATVSAATTTRTRTSRTSAQPGPRAAALGGDDDRDRADDHRRRARGLRARRRLVDLDRGRLARGPLRAHRRDHRRRAADPDARAGVENVLLR